MARLQFGYVNVLLAAGLLLAGLTLRVHAQEIEADLTTHAISVETDFSGAKVALFGAVSNDSGETYNEPPDIIIVVRGPSESLSIHRKRRIGGIWINADGASFNKVPGYYATLTNRPIAEIASFRTLGELGIGVSSVKSGLLTSVDQPARQNAGDYIEAIVRVLTSKKLYQKYDGGIRFIGKYLFRADFELPANVPIGKYEADVFLFRNTQLLSQYTTRLDIEKRGLEQWLYSLAHQQPLLYGIASVLLAVAAGMIASAIFRKR